MIDQEALFLLFTTTLRIGSIMALLLVLTHILLWSRPWRLSRPVAYGVGTIGIGIGIFASGHLDVFAVASGVALPCIVAVTLCYYVRGVLHIIERGGRKRDALLQAMAMRDDVEEDDGTAR